MSTFHKIDKNSNNAITNALSIFDLPNTNVSISSSSIVEFLTLNPVNIKPFHFKIHASQSFYDLSKCYILSELRIKKENAAGQLIDLDGTENVSVCQMIGNTLWKNCRMAINGTQVFEGNSLMAYKNYFDHILTYPQTVKDSYLNVAGFYTDDETSQTSGSGYNSRKELFKKSKTAQFIAKLDVDLCNQTRYLVNQCEVDIELLPNDSNFLIIAPDDASPKYQIEIMACKLYCKKLDLMDSLAYDINKKLELKPALYPIRRSTMRSFFIRGKRIEFNGALWTDHVPKRVVIAMLPNDNFVGSQKTSPFDFQHFKVREISISASGVNIPSASYNFDFENDKYARAFHDMNENLGYAGTLESNGISLKRYKKGGCCFFVFNLTNSGEDNGLDTFDLVRNGTTGIKISFSTPVPDAGIELIAMGEHESLLYLDKNRTISSDSRI
jgi:hypothetical protein